MEIHPVQDRQPLPGPVPGLVLTLSCPEIQFPWAPVGSCPEKPARCSCNYGTKGLRSIESSTTHSLITR